MKRFNFLPLISILVLLGSCASSASSAFLKTAPLVKPGMPKSEVVQLLGNPTYKSNMVIGSFYHDSFIWYNRDVSFGVVFDNNGKAGAAYYIRSNVDVGYSSGSFDIDNKNDFVFGEAWHQKLLSTYIGLNNK